jgi:coenzyme PQQ biosynthesis protein PqqD
VIGPGARVRLARKARLRKDPRSGRTILLYPERGLELSDTAAAIAALCTGERTVGEIVDTLRDSYAGAARARVEDDVVSFLHDLEVRGLLIMEPGP